MESAERQLQGAEDTGDPDDIAQHLEDNIAECERVIEECEYRIHSH